MTTKKTTTKKPAPKKKAPARKTPAKKAAPRKTAARKPAAKPADSKPKRGKGRPTVYSKALGDTICERLIAGESLRSICRDPAMPALSTVALWIVKFDEYEHFSEQYAKARAAQAEILAEEIQEIADDGTNDWMEKRDAEGHCIGYQLNGEHVQRSKLRIDARKWTAARLLPKKYGDKVTNVHEGGDTPVKVASISTNLTPEEAAQAYKDLLGGK